MTDYELQMTRIKKLEVQPGIEIDYMTGENKLRD